MVTRQMPGAIPALPAAQAAVTQACPAPAAAAAPCPAQQDAPRLRAAGRAAQAMRCTRGSLACAAFLVLLRGHSACGEPTAPLGARAVGAMPAGLG